jgi:hypothetical protein
MKVISKEITARLIEYNASEFFMNLGRLNMDELYDTPEIKYIFTKKNLKVEFSWRTSIVSI